MPKQIIIIVGTEGETTVETKGFAGPSCKDASRFIEEALGQKTTEKLKPEYHQNNNNASNRNNNTSN